MRKMRTTVMFPPSMTRVKRWPVSTTNGVAPSAARSCGAEARPMAPRTAATTTPMRMPCTAAPAARSGSFSPVRRATVAAVAMARPVAIA